jgi:hypothetical protein
MIMQDRSRRLSQPLSWGRREKTAVAGLLAVVLAAVIALGVFALTSGSPARRDCIEVTFASTLGGGTLRGCGEQARRQCAAGDFHSIEAELRAACRRAGFPFSGRE